MVRYCTANEVSYVHVFVITYFNADPDPNNTYTYASAKTAHQSVGVDGVVPTHVLPQSTFQLLLSLRLFLPHTAN